MNLRTILLVSATGIVLALGCSTPPIATEEVIEVKSCVAGARSVQLMVAVSPPVISASAEGTSSNVIGTPDVQFFGPGVQVTAELDNVALGEPVSLKFSAVASGFAMSVAVTDVVFYTVPPDQIPPEPGCSPSATPEFALANDSALGLVLHVSNPTSQPMTLSQLDLATNPSRLPIASLDWEDPGFNALAWHPAAAGAPLDPASPPLIIDLPDTAPLGAGAALCRFVSLFDGVSSRGILQADLTGEALGTQPTTWGAVKALYESGRN